MVKEQESVFVRLLAMRVGFLPAWLLATLLLLALAFTASNSLTEHFSCDPETYSPENLELTSQIEEIDDGFRINIYNGTKIVAYYEFTIYQKESTKMSQTVGFLNLKGLGNLIPASSQISFGDIFVHEDFTRHNISRYLFLSGLEELRMRGISFHILQNYADLWTQQAPKNFNPWIKPLQNCFSENKLTQLSNTPWKEVLIDLR